MNVTRAYEIVYIAASCFAAANPKEREINRALNIFHKRLERMQVRLQKGRDRRARLMNRPKCLR